MSESGDIAISHKGKDDLKELLLLIKSTKEGFTINEDLKDIITINNRMQEIKNLTSNEIGAQNLKIEDLKNKLSQTSNKISTLSNDIEKSQDEAKSFLNKDELFKKYSNELTVLERSNAVLKSEIEEKVKKLIKISNNGKGIVNPKVNFSETESTSEGTDINDDDKNNIFNDPTAINEEEELILNDPNARANILKIKLYRSMGVILDPDFKQLFIERKDTNKIDVLSLDDDYSDFYKVKFIWERISELTS